LTVKHLSGDHAPMASSSAGTRRRLPRAEAPDPDGASTPPDDFSVGVLIGLLVGEGHFGGDGVRAQVTLRMHTRHERLFRWLTATIPGSRLYGPYDHGGRRYFQWMVRGRALEDHLLPLIGSRLDGLDDYAAERFRTMRERYRLGARDD
jgi:hypothetical protein